MSDLAYVDQGCAGEAPAEARSPAEGIELHAVKLPEAKRVFVLLLKRWVERSFAWATRRIRLVKDYERYATTPASFHIVAFAYLMLKQGVMLVQSA